MKKLQIKTKFGWEYVFCRNAQTNKVITTDNKRKALPTLSIWGAEDLEFFSAHFANNEFRLANTLEP